MLCALSLRLLICIPRALGGNAGAGIILPIRRTREPISALSHGSGNAFSGENGLHTLRETHFQAKTDFPRFGKRIFKRKQTSHASGNTFSSENRLPTLRETTTIFYK